MFLTLGIESSCDETSVALLADDTVLVSETYTQEIHSRFGGVVPEIASRAHLGKIDRLCSVVLEKAKVEIPALDLIAVTDGPGLAGALLVGVSFALGLHRGSGVPVTGVHHLEGHICSILLEPTPPPYPFLALVVSGGHTAVYLVRSFGTYEILGQTVDDAAGEAFDKVGKMVGFPYPAGRAIQDEAAKASSTNGVVFPIARPGGKGSDFSFSGLKTAVKYHLQSLSEDARNRQRPSICKAFQNAVIDALCTGLERAVASTGLTRIAVVGGVACNAPLREKLTTVFGSAVSFPRFANCTDNAAMIARAGLERFRTSLTTRPRMDPSRSLGQGTTEA